MKKRDLWVIVAAALCAAALLVGAQFIQKNHKTGHMGTPSGVTIEFGGDASAKEGGLGGWLFASACAEETAEEKPAQGAEESEAAPLDLDEETIAALTGFGVEPAESYLVVWMGDFFQPIPLIEKYDGQKLRVSLDGENYNIIEVKKNGFDMHEASCPDQVCVGEGEVTLENRSSRILGNFIICMPNNIALEMYDAQEMLLLLAESVAHDGQ